MTSSRNDVPSEWPNYPPHNPFPVFNPFFMNPNFASTFPNNMIYLPQMPSMYQNPAQQQMVGVNQHFETPPSIPHTVTSSESSRRNSEESTSSESTFQIMNCHEIDKKIIEILDEPIPEMNPNLKEIFKEFEKCINDSNISLKNFNERILKTNETSLKRIMKYPSSWTLSAMRTKKTVTRMHNWTKIEKSVRDLIWNMIDFEKGESFLNATSSGATSSGAMPSGTTSSGVTSSGATSSGVTSSGATSSEAKSSGATSSEATSSYSNHFQRTSEYTNVVTNPFIPANFTSSGQITPPEYPTSSEMTVSGLEYPELQNTPNKTIFPNSIKEIFEILDAPIPENNLSTKEISDSFRNSIINSEIPMEQFKENVLNRSSNLNYPCYSSIHDAKKNSFTRMYNWTKLDETQRNHIWKIMSKQNSFRHETTSSGIDFEDVNEFQMFPEELEAVTSSGKFENIDLTSSETYRSEDVLLSVYSQTFKYHVAGIEVALKMCKPNSQNIQKFKDLKKVFNDALKVLEEPDSGVTSSEYSHLRTTNSFHQKGRNETHQELPTLPDPGSLIENNQNAETGPFGCHQNLFTEKSRHSLYGTSSGTSSELTSVPQSVFNTEIPSHLNSTRQTQFQNIGIQNSGSLKRKSPTNQEYEFGYKR